MTASDDWNQAYYGKKVLAPDVLVRGDVSNKGAAALLAEVTGRREEVIGSRSCNATGPRLGALSFLAAAVIRVTLALVAATHARQTAAPGRTTANVPPTMSAQPAIIGQVIVSPSSSAPQAIPNTGIRNATVNARVGPISAMSR